MYVKPLTRRRPVEWIVGIAENLEPRNKTSTSTLILLK